jgi:hypothetical protein
MSGSLCIKMESTLGRTPSVLSLVGECIIVSILSYNVAGAILCFISGHKLLSV